MHSSEKNLNFFENVKGGKFAVECVSNNTISLKYFSALIIKFFGKIEKFLTLEKLENMMVFSSGINAFIFSKKAFFTKMGRRKKCRW